MSKKLPKVRMALVRWNDAWGGPSFYSPGNDYTPLECTDIGYIVEENEDTLVLASSYDEMDRYRHVNVIPWEMVVSIEELVDAVQG